MPNRHHHDQDAADRERPLPGADGRSDAAPLVSAVVPTYRRPELLAEAIASILAQTERDLEVLVVDDDPDGSARPVVEAVRDPRVRYLRNDRARGGSGARNAGAFRARGRWIAFLDDDDLWEPTKIERQIERASRPDAPGLVYCGHVKIDPDGRETSRSTPDLEGAGVHRELLYRNRIGGLFSVLVRADAFRAVGGMDERFPALQDMELYVRLAREVPVGVVPDALVLVREGRPDRISANVRKKLEGSLLFREKFRSEIAADPRLAHRAASRVLAFAVAAGDARAAFAAVPWFLAGLAIDPRNVLRTGRTVARMLRARRSARASAAIAERRGTAG